MDSRPDHTAHLSQVLDVLHDISDALQRLEKKLGSSNPSSRDPARSRSGPLLLSLTDATEFLGLSERSMRQLVFERRIPVTRIGRRIYFQTDELTKWINEQTEMAVSAE